MATLRGYHEYRPTDLNWLERVPAHWDIQRNGRLFRQRNETGHPHLPILEVSLRTGVRVRNLGDTRRKQVMSDPAKYKRAHRGDVAYNMMRMWQGAVGVAPVDGLVSPAYMVAGPQDSADPRYFSYLFRTGPYKAQSNAFSRGIVQDRNRLYWDDFKAMPSCVPPRDEQRQISQFLDAHGHTVERFIRNRHMLIFHLRQEHQALTTSLVLGGADPSTTNTDWSDRLPSGWTSRRLRSVATVLLSNVDKVVSSDEQPVRLCNYVDVYRNTEITSDLTFTAGSATSSEIATFALRAGDVAITKDSESWEDIGVPAYVSADLSDVVYGYHLAIIRSRTDVLDGAYLASALRTTPILHQFRVAATGVTRFGLSHDAIKSVLIPLPPLDEQRAIVQQIGQHAVSIANAIGRAEREIELALEFRDRLIEDVVLGRTDVRAISVPDIHVAHDYGADIGNPLEDESDEVEFDINEVPV